MGEECEVFVCERCGSSYSSVRAAVTENCPRCLLRDRVSSPLTFKLFRLPLGEDAGPPGDERERETKSLAGAGTRLRGY